MNENQQLALFVSVILPVVIVMVVLVSQFWPRKATIAKLFWILPLILLGSGKPGPAAPTIVSVLILLVGVAGTAGFGILRGYSMRVWRTAAGQLFCQATTRTFWLWLATLGFRIIYATTVFLLFHEQFRIGSLWLGLAATLVAQSCVVLWRGRYAE